MTLPVPVKIAGVGRYLPGCAVPNSEVEKRCNLPTGWIEQRTGVRERRWADGESNAFMAAQAAREAVKNAGLELTDIDLIINASGTQQQAIPDGGPLLQQELGMGQSGVPAFSIHATCLSFLMALDVATGFLVTERYRRILIVTAEVASCGINFQEPESAALIGDAAAAVIVTLTPADEVSALHAVHFETYGCGADLTVVKGGGSGKHPNHPDTRPEDNLFHMNGPQLLRMTHRYAPDFLERLRPGLSEGLGAIKLVIPHQASLLALRMLRHFGWPDEHIMITLDRFGNCVSASIPVALYEAIKQGRLHRGDEVLLAGTGAGLSLGGVILTY